MAVKSKFICIFYCPAVNAADVAAREGLQRGGEPHPCTLQLSYCPLQQSTVIFPERNASPDHNRATHKSIPSVNASVGEKSEARLVRKKDTSTLPHWKSPGCMGC